MSNGNLDLTNVDVRHLQKAIFVYNAVINGWTVKQLDDGRYEFVKEFSPLSLTNGSDSTENSDESSQGSVNQYLMKFIRNNLCLDRLGNY